MGYCVDSNYVALGFLYDGSHWTALTDPLDPCISGSGPPGTFASGISGANIVGTYTGCRLHGFLATPIPRLTITLSGNTPKVSWPYWNNASTGWTLQQNFDLTTTNWTASSGGVSNDGTNNFITIPPPTGNLFFRLSQQ